MGVQLHGRLSLHMFTYNVSGYVSSYRTSLILSLGLQNLNSYHLALLKVYLVLP